MCMNVCQHVCVCITWMANAYGGQKRALDPLELELETVVSCHVYARNRTQVQLLTTKPSCTFYLIVSISFSCIFLPVSMKSH